MIRTIRPLDRPDPGLERVAKANGFSLHAGVSCEGKQKDKRERLCRYIARPAVAVPRLSLSSTGKVVYTLKTPYRDGTTQVAFDPVDFIARLAALIPKPRVNLTRYHGVLAPNHRWRGMVTPAKRGKGVKRIANTEVRSPAERHVAMSWAQRLKRVSMGRPSASILKFVVAAVGPQKSSSERRTVALRIRTSSTESWHIFERRNRKPLPGPSWCPQPGRHLPRCLFSQEANRQPQISKDATEKRVARTAADSRSGMSGYELLDQLSEQFFRPAGGYFANFSSSVGSNSEEIYSRQVLYSSYTSLQAGPVADGSVSSPSPGATSPRRSLSAGNAGPNGCR